MPLHGTRAPRARRLTVALVVALGAASALAPSSGAVLRVGPNYRLNNDSNPFRGKDQVALAVDPSNQRHIVEFDINYLTENCEASASFDGGVTWTQAFQLSPPSPAAGQEPFVRGVSCRIGNHLGESSFQTLAFGRGDSVYATAITARVAANGGEQGASTLVYKSTDGGRNWAPGVVSMPGGEVSKTGPYYELPTLAVDPGAGTNGADRVISVAHETTGFGNSAPILGNGAPGCPATAPALGTCPAVHVTVSNDGGATWSAGANASPPGVPVAGPDSSSPPVISPDHSVSVAWRTLGHQGTIQIARSTDGGQSWAAPVDVTGVTAGGLATSSHENPSPATGSSFPRLAVDHHNGNLYIVYNQGSPGPTAPAGGYRGADHFINADSHVYFQRSLNHGSTWSVPKLIDDLTPHPGTPVIQTRHPSVSVAPNGRVDIVWEDRRHWYQGSGEHDCLHTHLACDDARLGDTYYAYSTNGGTSFSRNIRVSDRSHNNDVGYDYRFGTYWAFGPQAVALGSDHLLVAWMDSREGSFDNDNQDIYLANVNFKASGPVPQRSVLAGDPISLSVAISRFTYLGGGEGLLAGTFATRRATRVVIVNPSDHADALAGAVLARANLGPVLLSNASGLSNAVKAEVTRLAPAGAFVLGGTGQLSDTVVSDLASAGVDPTQVVRLAGADAPSTAALIAAQMDHRTAAEKAAGSPAFDAAVIANPSSSDAGAAIGLAAARRLPILWASSGSIPAATTAALASLNVTKTLVIGDSSTVSDTVLHQLPGATRLGGSDQYATSHAVVRESLGRGLPSNVVYAVDGRSPLDAALAGAAVGRLTGIMMLARTPLWSKAPATASGDGLRNIDQFVVIGPAAPPQISHAGMTNRVFAVGRGRTPRKARAARGVRRGTVIRYTLSEAATMRIVIGTPVAGHRTRHGCRAPAARGPHARRCTRLIVRGTLIRISHQGANRVRFSGRIGSRALRPGSYEAKLTAKDAAGHTSRAVVIRFRIV